MEITDFKHVKTNLQIEPGTVLEFTTEARHYNAAANSGYMVYADEIEAFINQKRWNGEPLRDINFYCPNTSHRLSHGKTYSFKITFWGTDVDNPTCDVEIIHL